MPGGRLEGGATLTGGVGSRKMTGGVPLPVVSGGPSPPPVGVGVGGVLVGGRPPPGGVVGGGVTGGRVGVGMGAGGGVTTVTGDPTPVDPKVGGVAPYSKAPRSGALPTYPAVIEPRFSPLSMAGEPAVSVYWPLDGPRNAGLVPL